MHRHVVGGYDQGVIGDPGGDAEPDDGLARTAGQHDDTVAAARATGMVKRLHGILLIVTQGKGMACPITLTQIYRQGLPGR